MLRPLVSEVIKKSKMFKFHFKENQVVFETLKNQQKLWSSDLEFDQTWKKRISVMASYIDIPGSVADFGCGMMWLESFLKKENDYIPIDYIQRDSRTIVADLNDDPLPKVKADIAFLSGVLEYISDLDKFVNDLTEQQFKKIIVSYCTLEKFPDISRRKELNWVSHESIFTLLSLFLKTYDLTAINNVNKNIILVFSKK